MTDAANTPKTAAGPREHTCPECGCECRGAVQEIERRQASAPTPRTATRVRLRDAITKHIEEEAQRVGTYHGDSTATPGGTGYCIPAAVATQIVDKYLIEAEAAAPTPADLPDDATAADEDYMCPNCVTPWKCNGPHLPAAPTPAEPLDVERLARAMEAEYLFWLHDENAPDTTDYQRRAAKVAAEYNRLAAARPEAAMRRMVERAQASGTYDEYRPTATRTGTDAPTPAAPDVDVLGKALEVAENEGLIVILGLGDPETRTDFTSAPAEAAHRIARLMREQQP